ncbi:MAG: fumarylacetoacetate hydrolase family protein [Pseudomonadota bacterium]
MLDADGALRDLTGIVDDLAGDVLGRLSDIETRDLPVVEGAQRLGVPVGGVGKIIGIGLNYADHAAEAGMAAPDAPIVFLKATSSLNGPADNVILPRGSQKTDWEVELGVVIGRRTKYVEVAEALEYVAGYTIVNDLSERAFQLEGTGQWTKGKSCDTFCPVGPWLVTPEEVGDPQALALSLDVNGTQMQHGSTATMIFSVAEIIVYLSQMMTLEPGDIIATGTPPGVGMGQRPQVFLKDGDEMVLEIDGLGTQRAKVRANA